MSLGPGSDTDQVEGAMHEDSVPEGEDNISAGEDGVVSTEDDEESPLKNPSTDIRVSMI